LYSAGAGGVKSPDLALFIEEIQRLQAAAQAVRLLCTDAVRAGGFAQVAVLLKATRVLSSILIHESTREVECSGNDLNTLLELRLPNDIVARLDILNMHICT
jgi:hypothetical protein